MYYRVFWINQASETFFSNSDKIAFLENLPWYRFRKQEFFFHFHMIYMYSISLTVLKFWENLIFFKIVILVSKISILTVSHFSTRVAKLLLIVIPNFYLVQTQTLVLFIFYGSCRFKFDSGFRDVQGWARIAPPALLNSNGRWVGATIENTVVFGAHLTGDRAIKLIVGVLGDLASAR